MKELSARGRRASAKIPSLELTGGSGFCYRTAKHRERDRKRVVVKATPQSDSTTTAIESILFATHITLTEVQFQLDLIGKPSDICQYGNTMRARESIAADNATRPQTAQQNGANLSVVDVPAYVSFQYEVSA